VAEEVLKIDLDNKDFLEGVLKAVKGLESIAQSAEGIHGVGSAFLKLGKLVGVATAALFALKGVSESVFRGDEINKANEQFEILSKTAGFSGESIRKSFLDATNGMLTTQEAITAANSAIVKLGSTAQRLPEIMELARKASEVTGKSTLEVFNELSQALATGSSRALKQFGIIVDSEKVYRDYAKSIGVAVDELTDQAKIQAISNAAISEGRRVLSGVGTEANTAKDSFELLIKSVKELYDQVSILLNKAFGPVFRAVFDGVSGRIKTVSEFLKEHLGAGTETAAEKIEKLQNKIMGLKAEMIDLEQKKIKSPFLFLNTDQARMDQLAKMIPELQEKLNQLRESQKGKEEAPISERELVDLEKRRKNEEKFQAEILKMREANLNQAISQAQSIEQVEALSQERKLVLEQEFQLKVAQLKENAALTDDQRRQMIIELETQKNLKLMEMDMELESQRERSLDNYLNKSKSTADGVARAFEVGSKKSQMWMKDFGKQGKVVFDAFSSNAETAFLNLGSGAQNASQALKGFFYGAIADTAQAFGRQILLASIWPPNPVGVAAGGALIALAGFLRAHAKGATSTSFGGGTGLSAGEAPGFGTRLETTEPGKLEPGKLEEKERKMVSIQIQGNYFETEQTRTRLVEIIRESSDFTDFQVKQIGS
jgi:hypothetical protein